MPRELLFKNGKFMNKIKKLFVCSTFMLLPMCVNAAVSLEETNFVDLHGANKKLTNNVLVNIRDKGDTFYNELNFQ